MRVMTSLGVTQYRKMKTFSILKFLLQLQLSSPRFEVSEKPCSTDLNLKFENWIFEMSRT